MEKIIVALDGFTELWQILKITKAVTKAETLAGERIIWGFKVNDALIKHGNEIIMVLKDEGFRVMVDPKLYDIPNTINHSLNQSIGAGADIVTVHCSANYEPHGNEEEKIAGITILTSMSEADCQKIYNCSIEETVNKFAIMARNFYYGYCVCSARDIPFLPEMGGTKLICPGIRLEDTKDDQKRKMTPREAIKAGADLLVVGRPILNAVNPIQAINEINEEIKKADNEKGW